MTNLLTEKEIDIHLPIQEVFDFISNMENFQSWFPEVSSIVAKNDLKHGEVGKTYLELVNLPPDGVQELEIKVKQSHAPELYVTESDFMPLLPRMTIRLSAQSENSTHLIWKMESRNQDETFMENGLPQFQAILNDRAAQGVRNLKTLLEKEMVE